MWRQQIIEWQLGSQDRHVVSRVHLEGLAGVWDDDEVGCLSPAAEHLPAESRRCSIT